MKKASEYREHAVECRKLASTMESEAQREQLLQMAEHWDQLAIDRLHLITKHPDLAKAGEEAEERTWLASQFGSER
jgi:hypothetical protein